MALGYNLQSELKDMVGELIYEVKYQILAGPGGQATIPLTSTLKLK